MKKQLFIAEVKIQSPFGFKSKYSWEYLLDVATEYGDVISIHTDPKWGGSFDLVKRAKDLTGKPILAKGIHSNDSDLWTALDNGAWQSLVVGRIPKICLCCHSIIEPLNLEQLKMIPSDMWAVWNSRDLSTGGLKLETWEQAREIHKGILIQASNIKTIQDVKSDAYGYIVGENLVEFVKTIK